MAHFSNGGLRRFIALVATSLTLIGGTAAAQGILLEFGINPPVNQQSNLSAYTYVTGETPAITTPYNVLRVTGQSGIWISPMLNIRVLDPVVENYAGGDPEVELTPEGLYAFLMSSACPYDFSWLLGQQSPAVPVSDYWGIPVVGNQLVRATSAMINAVTLMVFQTYNVNDSAANQVRYVYQPIVSSESSTTQSKFWEAAPDLWTPENILTQLWTGVLSVDPANGSKVIMDPHGIVEFALRYQADLANFDMEELTKVRDASDYPSQLGPAPQGEWSYLQLIATKLKFDLDIQFIGMSTCVTSGPYSSPASVPGVFNLQCPLPVMTFSNVVTINFGAIQLPAGTPPQRNWLFPSLPLPKQSQGKLGATASVRTSAVISPATVTWKDAANVVRTASMSFERPGYWSFPVPAGAATGVGSIVSIVCPSGTIVGNPTRLSSQINIVP
jgi:hypothetical protein